MVTEPSPLVSIVILCHNYGRFLGEAIGSALAQTHHPIEVVVVDDGSTDDTVEVARRYPVKLITQPNRGVCVAGNAGFAAATGEFVMRLDADDKLAPQYVEKTLRALEQHPDAHFAYTAAEYFGARTGTYPIESFSAETLAERNYVNASALMRASSLRKIGGYNLNMREGRYEDWDLWLSFAERGLTGVMVPERLLLYRQHASASRGTLRMRTRSELQREVRMARRLRLNHPRLFRPSALVRRLLTLPRRVLKGEAPTRHAALLLLFYSVMLAPSGAKRLMEPQKLRSVVHDYWNAHPCGTEWTDRPKFSPEYFSDIERFRYSVEPMIAGFAQFSRWRGQRILEVGVGAGTDFTQFVRAGAEAHGVDVTAEAVEHVSRRLEIEGLRAADIRVADAESLPFSDNTFDLVYSWGVIHHTPDVARALQEIVRVCRVGGTCKLMVYHRYSLLAVFLWIRWALLAGRPWESLSTVVAQHMESPGTQAFTVNEFADMLRGLSVDGPRIRTVLSREDALASNRNPLVRQAGRALAKLIGHRAGWFMTIEFVKSGQA